MSGRPALAPPGVDAAIWHDVECSSYDVDLSLWRELADESAGPVLELGCGTGRVALDLAARGHEVTGLDSDAELVTALGERASERGLPARGVVGDVRSFALGRRFDLAVLPMQVVQLLRGRGQRASMLAAASSHLEPGAVLAIALADPLEGVPAGPITPPLPDVLERDGWVFSSIPVAVREDAGAVVVERVREAVSPAGELSRAEVAISLERVTAAMMEQEGANAGYTVRPSRQVTATSEYVGTTVVLLEAPS